MRSPKKRRMGVRLLFLLFLLLAFPIYSRQQSSDASAVLDLKKALENPPASWVGDDPCSWASESGIHCQESRVTRIQLGNRKLRGGPLPATLANLTSLTVLELMGNSLQGPLPSLSGMSSLQTLNLHDNLFSFLPPDMFTGMSSLSFVSLDYNPFSAWRIPESLQDAAALQYFSANGANITGPVPDFLSTKTFPGLLDVHLAQNFLEGPLPETFSGSTIQSLWLNGQQSVSKLNGSIDVISNMTNLVVLWLNLNSFTGALPDFSGLTALQNVSFRDNHFTGPFPDSLKNLPSLVTINLTNNMLQGPSPKFSSKVVVDMIPGSNRFCSDDPSVRCSSAVNALLDVAGGFLYPEVLADSWIGNDPCSSTVPWKGIVCSGENITVVNFINFGLSGVISPSFSMIPSLQKILLSNNSITGVIPESFTNLTKLVVLDVSNNQLHGPVPQFRPNLLLDVKGNADINKTSIPSSASPTGAVADVPGNVNGSGETIQFSSGSGNSPKKSKAVKIFIALIVVVCCLCIFGLGFLCFRSKKRSSSKVQSPNMVVFHPRDSNDDAVKITVAGSSASLSSGNSNPASDVHVVESGNMVISIQVLRNVTNNFSERNVLGQGGFGTVYKGELHDGTKIAVKRMESGVVSEKGLSEFQSEIAVLTKVRHRHLVALLGYCLDGNEKLLVYEYMPQGTLSRYLFNSKEEGIKPLEWTRRLVIALDVARGVEYLHGLAQQTFIHRDLKPSNILLGDDMRAKVSDFGLVRLAPEGGKASIATRLAGTFGYLAPEYAVTGRVTTKIDVFSFGVILMEIITGRKALDESRPEESMHLVTWFRRMCINKETLREAIDPSIDLSEETLASVTTVAELAGHCTAREPHQRPDMGHAVNVLSSLVELWKPAETDVDDVYGIDFDMTLPQALKKWQAFEGGNHGGDSSYLGSSDNTQTSIPNRPSGFADSFTSNDAR